MGAPVDCHYCQLVLVTSRTVIIMDCFVSHVELLRVGAGAMGLLLLFR